MVCFFDTRGSFTSGINVVSQGTPYGGYANGGAPSIQSGNMANTPSYTLFDAVSVNTSLHLFDGRAPSINPPDFTW